MRGAPRPEDLLAVVASALEEVVLPALEDQQAASTCRTALQLVRSARAQALHEPSALQADAEELEELLGRWAAALPAAEAQHVARVLDTPASGLADRVGALEACLAGVLDHASPDDPLQRPSLAVLRRAHERRDRWLVDPWTGPRR